MTRSRTYRCLSCLDHTVTRTFDTAHLSVTCPNCGSFERFVNGTVFEQFEQFEASPPAELDWDRLGRTEKLLVAERIARTTKTVEDFDIVADDGEPTVG
ncbi:hypothetical protein GJ633_10095 [Halorubrum sp. CBA1125]|uniref:hypothetical protein n=1 Tax=Halorubrum sp. CBA1125 TaxID=2668072 RepID=UPI00135DE225|nr:hypothetical protein [Halorubrum sp. CBA1125]MUW14975.1 hypothetical protein [Halorubrum sp. CBA1125]